MSEFYIKKPEYTKKTLRLPTDLVERMSTVAQNQNISFTELLIQSCEYALEHLGEVEAGE